MLTSHKLLQQYWHDDRYDIGKLQVWYIDRGAPNDHSRVCGPDICLEPYYLSIRIPDGEKPVPYHRILLITYDGKVTFENRKIRGLAHQLREESEWVIADQGNGKKDGYQCFAEPRKKEFARNTREE